MPHDMESPLHVSWAIRGDGSCWLREAIGECQGFAARSRGSPPHKAAKWELAARRPAARALCVNGDSKDRGGVMVRVLQS